MDFITVTAKTVDEAVNEALIELQVTSDKIEYEVIEKGSAGFLGFGAKPAVIRARKKPESDEVEKIEKEILKSVSPKAVNDDIQAEKAPAEKEERAASPKPVKEEKKPAVSAPEKREAVSGEKAPKSEKPRKAADPETVIRDAEKFLNDVFHAMGFTAEVKAEFRAEEKELAVLISGDDMGVLIGKRGQTLDSLQYLVSLVVNKSGQEYIRIKLDTENYRERRKETLETLARNIAYKVKRSRRPVSLEPMNPYERRSIHSALQNDQYVMTKSDGEDPYRHVTIFPKRKDHGDGERGERRDGRPDRGERRPRRNGNGGGRSWNNAGRRGSSFRGGYSHNAAGEAVEQESAPAEQTKAPEVKNAPAAPVKNAEEEIPKWKRDMQKYGNSVKSNT